METFKNWTQCRQFSANKKGVSIYVRRIIAFCCFISLYSIQTYTPNQRQSFEFIFYIHSLHQLPSCFGNEYVLQENKFELSNTKFPVSSYANLPLLARHLSEQYLTSAQFFSHFLRQANGLLQAIQTFSGRFSFLTPFILFSVNPVFHLI
jgi:hypothetical protein